MCGRYSITTPPDALRELFDFDDLPNLAPRYNLAPTQMAPVVRMKNGRRRLDSLTWGLVPAWSRDSGGGGAPLINARAETVADKPSFRDAFVTRPCLVPADGYYEWQAAVGGKQVMRLELTGRRPFAFAGLWECWRGDGRPRETFTIVTTAAAPSIAHIHHRMPVILAADAFAPWLTANLATRQDLLQPYEGSDLLAYAVDPRIGRVGEDDAALLTPYQAAQGSLF